MAVAAKKEIVDWPKCCRKVLPVDAHQMAEECGTRLGAGVVQPVEDYLLAMSDISGTEAVALAVRQDVSAARFLSVFPLLDLRYVGTKRIAFSEAPSLVGRAYDRLAEALWQYRRDFRTELTYINTRGEHLREVAHEISDLLDTLRPVHGGLLPAVEPFLTLGEIVE